jgi:RNA polymerase sigma factor (sigma-70 family)
MDPADVATSRSFDDFYAEAFPVLRRLAVARAGSSAAEELVQDVLADAYRRWDVIGSYDDPLSWGRRAVLNRSASWWRRAGREARAITRLSGRRESVPEHALSDTQLWSAIRALPGRQLEVVLLLWFEDLPVDRVAAILGCGQETVRTHWRRARARLAIELGEQE